MSIGILNLTMKLQDVHSLKEKRHRIRPFINDLSQKFNISIAETNYQDIWDRLEITCAMVSNDSAFLDKSLKKIITLVETKYYQFYILEENIEILI